MKTLVDICARLIYGVFGLVTVGLSAAAFGGVAGWLSELSFGHGSFFSMAYFGGVTGSMLGVLVGVLGKMKVVHLAESFWTGLPYMLLGAVSIGYLLACVTGSIGLLAGVVFCIEDPSVLAMTMAVTGGLAGLLVGTVVGFWHQSYTLTFLGEACTMLIDDLAAMIFSIKGALSIAGIILFIACTAIAMRFLH